MTTNTIIESQIEKNLIDGIRPIRKFSLAICIYHLFDTGLYDWLNTEYGRSIKDTSKHFDFDCSKLKTFFQYLLNENIIESKNDLYSLSINGKKYKIFEPWYTMLVGGYAETFLQVGPKLKTNSGWASRNLTKVGIGSCGISHFDAIPLTRSLINKTSVDSYRLLDLGCGNGLYLIEFCKAFQKFEAWGIEPDSGSCQEANTRIAEFGFEKRVHIINKKALDFLNSDFPECNPNFIFLGFVMHEVLAQEGRSGAIEFFKQIIKRYPEINIIIIEVINKIEEQRIMQHGLSLAYYNPYYLLHAFTCQKLETRQFWINLFADADLEILSEETTDPRVDSTGLEIGFLLKKKRKF